LLVVLVCKLLSINTLSTSLTLFIAIGTDSDAHLAVGGWDKATILQYKSNFFWPIHQIFSNFSTPNQNTKRVLKVTPAEKQIQ
jgi:hypothetical protein